MKFRIDRLQKELHKLIYSIFHGDLADPRISGLDITRVKLTKDMKLLKVYFANYDQNIPLETILELLSKSSGFIKKQIAGATIMRTIPQIIFEYDDSNQRIESIEKVFQSISSEKRNKYYDSDNDYYDDDDDYLNEDDLEDYDDYNDDLDDEDLDFDYEDDEDDD